jgi:DNA-binding response OmpR family regulator
MGSTKRSPASDVRLEGRRVVVADDDPAVVWFLADLLKTAGCEVLEAFDGRKALELAYESSPDLVISDILMPNLDGFSLCRALRRDVALRDTPCILLSWKEDLLQRVRELGANASGYVRKESDTRAIIARVREALGGRARIETRLREDGEVRGRLDGVSMKTLLEVVSASRPNARLSVRDATFLYEVEIRDGQPRRVTRTDAEGGFAKGKAMLTQMLGVGAGRFTVTTCTSTVESELEGNLASQLAKPIAKARAAISLLTGSRMNTVARMRFDEHALIDYLKATPEKARLVARRLANGAAPRELVLHGGCEAALLDDILCDLAARGLVVAIEGADGADMLTPAIQALLPHSDTRADLPIRGVTPPPANSCADDAANPTCVSPAPSPAASVEEALLREVEHRSPSPAPVKALREMFPFGSPMPMPMIVDPTALKPRLMTPSPTFYEATGTPPAEQIIALGEATEIENTIYASASPPAAGLAMPEDEEDDIYHSDAIVPGAEEVEIPPELTPFATVAGEDTPPELPMAKRKAWPMLAFITATGVVAWAVLHFTSHPLGMPKMNQSSHDETPPPAEMQIPPPPLEQDRADDDFYKAQKGEMKADDAPSAAKDAGAKAPKTTSNTKPDNVEGLSRLAHLAH